jgi:hypothetical protein
VQVIAYNIYGNSVVSSVGNGAIILTYPDAPLSLAEAFAQRTATALGLTWSQGAANGGTPVIDFTISYAANLGSLQVLAANVLTPSYLATGLASGATYDFWVQSRNSYGLSAYSAALQLVSGFKPSVPAAPTTSVITNNVILTWVAPNNNGAPITSYRISIKQADGTYSEDLTNCDGLDSDFVTSRTCTIPLLTLQASPYNLLLGDSVAAIVTATNSYGESAASSSGSGAVIL